MNTLAVAVLFVAVAYSNASGIAGVVAPTLVSSKGALEGALGGQWIPDGATVAGAAVVAPGVAAVSARGAIEGALGGQWIPDVPVARSAVVAPAVATSYAAPLATPWASPLAAPWAAPLAAPWAAPLAAPWAAPAVISKGALEGALGGQWVPDTLGK